MAQYSTTVTALSLTGQLTSSIWKNWLLMIETTVAAAAAVGVQILAGHELEHKAAK